MPHAEPEVAVMVGGPFDGDEGSIVPPPPDSIWCFPCPHGPGAECEFDGIHWTRYREKAPCGAVEYLWTTVDDADRHVYKYGDLLEPQGLEARTDVEELARA
jgi:hypothetical protein